METAPTVLVTGAASGLGLATVRRLRSLGHRTVGLDLQPAPEDGADVHRIADVADLATVEEVIRDTVGDLGRLDAVAHCAGVFPRSVVPLHALPPEEWDRTIAVNLTGAFNICRTALPLLRARGGGAIVLVASVAGSSPQPGAATYAAAKSGVIGLARGIAVEYGRHGIRANAVCPGWMDTPMAAPVLDRADLRERIEADVPLGHVASPAEIADAICFLTSHEARYVTGEALQVDGGAGLMAYTSGAEIEMFWRQRG